MTGEFPQQYWVHVTDPTGNPYGSQIECVRCGYRPQFPTTHLTECPRCGPIYKAIAALQATVDDIKDKLK